MYKNIIERKEIILTLLKFPLRFLLMKLSKIHRKKYNQLAIYSQDYIGQTILIDGVYEIRELEIVESWLQNIKPEILNGICLDIGANIGNHSVFFSKIFNEVIAFEPIPSTYKLLKINTEDIKNITINNFGLSHANESVTFELDRRNYGGSRIISNKKSNKETFKLNVKKLDDLNIIKKNIKFIKIDVEGNELAVIKGSKDILIKFSPMIAFEQHISDFKNGNSPTINELKQFGYNKFYITKTMPVKLNKNIFFGKLLTLIYSLVFGGKKILIEEDNFTPDFYPLIIAEKI